MTDTPEVPESYNSEKFFCKKMSATLSRGACAARTLIPLSEKSSMEDRICHLCAIGVLHRNGEPAPMAPTIGVPKPPAPYTKDHIAPFLSGSAPPPLQRPKERQRPSHVVPAWVRPTEPPSEVETPPQPKFWGAIEPVSIEPVMTPEPEVVGLAAWVPESTPAGPFGLDRTPTIQSRARQESIDQITFDGRTQSVDEWAAEYGVHPQTLKNRARQGKPLNKRTYQSINRNTRPEAPTTAEEPQMPVTTPYIQTTPEQPPVQSNLPASTENLETVLRILGWQLRRESILGQEILIVSKEV